MPAGLILVEITVYRAEAAAHVCHGVVSLSPKYLHIIISVATLKMLRCYSFHYILPCSLIDIVVM